MMLATMMTTRTTTLMKVQVKKPFRSRRRVSFNARVVVDLV